MNRRKRDSTTTKRTDRATNNDHQNTTQKFKDRATQTPQKTEGELGCPAMVSSTGSTFDTRLLLLEGTNII